MCVLHEWHRSYRFPANLALRPAIVLDNSAFLSSAARWSCFSARSSLDALSEQASGQVVPRSRFMSTRPNKTSTSRLPIKEKSTSPQRKINGSAKTATNPPDKVEHIGGAMKPTCCSDRTETNLATAAPRCCCCSHMVLQACAHKAVSNQSISLTVRACHAGVFATALPIKSPASLSPPRLKTRHLAVAPLKMPSSASGQKRKCSLRANEVRFPPHSDQIADAVLCRLRANSRHPDGLFDHLVGATEQGGRAPVAVVQERCQWLRDDLETALR